MISAEALESGDTAARTARGLAVYVQKIKEVLGRPLARNSRLRQRFPSDGRAYRRFLRLFAVAGGGK